MASPLLACELLLDLLAAGEWRMALDLVDESLLAAPDLAARALRVHGVIAALVAAPGAMPVLVQLMRSDDANACAVVEAGGVRVALCALDAVRRRGWAEAHAYLECHYARLLLLLAREHCPKETRAAYEAFARDALAQDAAEDAAAPVALVAAA